MELKILDYLLQVRQENRSASQIIFWWELRRILYNMIVLVCGIISMGIMRIFINLKSGEDLQEPFAIVGFAFLCNVGYTFGWLSEIFNSRDKIYGPKMFKIGLCFTLFWVFLPAVLHFIFWLGRRFRGL